MEPEMGGGKIGPFSDQPHHCFHFSPPFPQHQLVGQENKTQKRKLDTENKLGFLY